MRAPARSNSKVSSVAAAVFLLVFVAKFFAFSEEDFKLGARFCLGVNNELEPADFYTIASELEFEFAVLDNFDCILELDADRFEVEVDEISFNWKPWDYIHLLVGKFENELTLEEYEPVHKRLFSTKSRVSDYVDDLGYTSSNIGAKIYKEYKKKTLPISYLLHVSFIPAHIEPQIELGFLYHFDKKDSYLGLLGAYFPFVSHSFWLEESVKSELHNFILDLIWADYENRFLYGLEFTFGSNLVDPIGLVHFPGEGERSYFLGGDLHLGYSFDFDGLRWIAAVRCSVLFPEITVMEAQQIEIILGNLFVYAGKLYFHFDGGLGINTQYRQEILYTKLEMLWAINFIVKI
jgi:hypothetical protein